MFAFKRSPWLQCDYTPFPLVAEPFHPFFLRKDAIHPSGHPCSLSVCSFLIARITLHCNFLLLCLWGSLGQWLGLIYYKEPRIAQWLFPSFPLPTNIWVFTLCPILCACCLGRWYKTGTVPAIMEHAVWQESEFWTRETIFMQFSTSVTFPAVAEQKQWMLEC